MRISAFVRHLPLLLAFTSPALLQAQFQQPTGEELKMTADPKAPGAAAVYLNIEEIDNDPIFYKSIYVRIKVLQEKGKELATVTLPYMKGSTKVTDIKGRTIHSDGVIIPFEVKPEDLLIAKVTVISGVQLQAGRKVFTLPSVEVGSILEYRYQIHHEDESYSSPTWEIQRPYFVHQARYSFTPAKAFWLNSNESAGISMVDGRGRAINALLYWPILPPGVTLKPDIHGAFNLDLKDIPAAPEEDWMPPINGLLYHVTFYYSTTHSGTEYWLDEAKHWSSNVDHFAETSMKIKFAVVGLISPSDSDLDKAKKLYRAVQDLDNTDFSRKKTESEMKQGKLKSAKHAEDTWAQKSGSSQDIALLYLAMLRAAGLTAYDMKVVDRSQRVFSINYLDIDQLDDDIILVNIAGKEIPLDPGEKMCPFGTLNWKHSATAGIRQGGKERNLAMTPEQDYTANKITRTGDITLDAQGAITGRLSIVMRGQLALYWRQAALKNDSTELNKQFQHWLEAYIPEGVETRLDNISGLDDQDTPLEAIVYVSGSLGASTPKRLMFPGFFFQTRSQEPFVNQEKRLEPVDMHYPEQVIDQIQYHLPYGLTVEGVPQNNRIAWEGHAIMSTMIFPGSGKISVGRVLSRSFSTVKPEDYQALRGFYQKVAAADQEQIVLAK
jgi:hypothetical protein